MSRLSDKAPQGGVKIQKLSDTEHAIFHCEIKFLGTVNKTDEGWKMDDGTTFSQEQDAIRQMYADAGITWEKPDREYKPKQKLHQVRPEQRYMKLAGFMIDTRTNEYKDYKYFRTTLTKTEAILEGVKSEAEREADSWNEIGRVDIREAQ